MKKTKKALASLAIAGMALTMVPFNAFATGTVPTRLAGTTAAQTAAAIADQTGWTGTAILASSASYGMVDALTAGPLASYLKAPILLTGAGNTLDSDTKAELTKLNVKKVYVTSGTAVISQAVLDQLSGMGITVVPLGGVDRAATSVNIAKQMGTVTKVAVANGLQDALSIAAVASAAGEPILLTDKDALPASVSAYLAANSGITTSDVIGGTGVISDAVKAALPNATRHAGNTAYDTNNQVIQDFASSLKFDNVYVANGQTGIDALAGAPLAAQTNSAIVLTDGTVPAAASFVHGKLASSSVVTALGGAAVVSDAVRTGVINGTTPQQGNLAVTSVSAISASSLKVVFNQAPADTKKVTFGVTNGGTPVTTTATWNAANTEVTLTSSSNFPEGTYSVDVKNDTADLGSSTVQFTAQRIGKITIDSTLLSIVSSDTKGYAVYHVYDQYGADITTSYLASSGNINWGSGIGTVTANDKGLLTVTPFPGSTILPQLPSCIITATTTNQAISASTSATLNLATTQGTLSDITLNKLTNADNTTPTVGDSETYFIDYTALDMSKNETNDLSLVEQGLLTSGSDLKLTTSNSDLVTAKLVPDPTNNNKAAILVTIGSPSYTLYQDQPVTVTATTLTGKTSSLTFTVKRAAALNSFTMMAPASYVASGEKVTIPFSAVDQNGTAITSFSKLNTFVTFSDSNLAFVENADGTASLQWQAPTLDPSATTAQQQTLTASVKSTGKFSSLNISVQPGVKVNGLSLDSSVIIPRMEVGASQKFDFGWNDGGFSVVDQYGRNVDMQTGYTIGSNTYFVEPLLPGYVIDATTKKVTSSGTSTVLSVSGLAYAGHEVSVASTGVAGTDNVIFALMQGDPTNPATAVYTGFSQPQSFTVLADKDITGYTLDTNKNAYLATAPVGSTAFSSTATGQQIDTNDTTELTVYGTNASGSKVVLNVANIMSRTSSNGDFYVLPDGTSTEIVANKFNDPTKTGSSSTISVTVWSDNDYRPHTATSTVTSSTAGQVAQSMSYGAYTIDRKDNANATGITTSGNTITVDVTGTQSYFTTASANSTALGVAPSSVMNALAGRELTRFDANTGSSSNRAYITLRAKDQYGSNDMNLSMVNISECSTVNGVPLAGIGANNTLMFNYMPSNTDYIVVSGVSTNGLVETVRINFSHSVVLPATQQAQAAAYSAISASVAALATPTIDAVAGANLGALPAADAVNGTTIAWASSDPTKVDNTGAYLADGTVTLTATISKAGGTNQTVSYTVTAAGGKITTISKN